MTVTSEEVKLIKDIIAEKRKAEQKWGIQEHNVFVHLAILGEEFGEVQQACLKAKFETIGGHVQIRREAVQLATMALTLLERIDKGNYL